MFEDRGYFFENLIRVRIGNVELGRLAPGEIRPLMRTEIIKLKCAVGLQDIRSEPERKKRARLSSLSFALGDRVIMLRARGKNYEVGIA